ncbi:MAG: J domain-containing protein, partial [Clostridia bacterium]|nr:J domain-containing protein [Clostridia bacterium]
RSNRANAPRRGQDILVSLNITFEEAVFGTQKTVSVKRVENCPHCDGTGAKDGKAFKVCTQCGGRGRVSVTQRTPFGQISTESVCPSCKGTGKIVTEKCPHCSGQGRSEKVREVKVNIPAGIDAGQRITYRGEGHSGINGGEKGSLVVEINISAHKLYKRSGFDIELDLPISFVDAAMGCTVSVPTLYGKHDLKIPECTQSGTVLKIRNMGIRKLRGSDKGDMYVNVIVEVPKSLTREQKELLKKLGSTFETKQHPLRRAYEDKQ